MEIAVSVRVHVLLVLNILILNTPFSSHYLPSLHTDLQGTSQFGPSNPGKGQPSTKTMRHTLYK